MVGPAGPLDVEVTAPDETLLGAVAEELAEVVGGEASAIWSGSTMLGPETSLRSASLAHGAVLGLGRPGPRPPVPTSALALDVVGGPDTGRSVALSAGRHTVGRGTAADIAVDDPDVSRRHVVLDVGAGRVSVHDAGSVNGSRLDGVPVGTEPVEWRDGAVLRIGSSALVVRGPRGSRLPGGPAPGGRTSLHPAAPAPLARPEVEVRLPADPTPPARRRLAWIAMLVPAAAGALGAWVFATPTFLFFALLSPLVALGTWLGDRWSGRRSHRRDAATHAADAARARELVAEAVRDDRRAADLAVPDLARLAGAVRRRTAPLWERRRGEPGALVVRLGRGTGATRVIRMAPDGTRTPETCDDLPVTVDLAATGGLTVVAPRTRSLGVVAGVLAQTCALLSPADLEIGVLTTPEGLDDWRFLRWSPHLDSPDVRVARASAADTDRADLAWLDAAVARRAGEAARPGSLQPAPAFLLVVLDRPAGPRFSAALHAVRDRGVLILATTTASPRETTAVVRITGETGSAAHLHLPGSPVRDLVVDHPAPSTAAAVVRELAPLSTPAAGAGGLPTAVRLLELLPPTVLADGPTQAAGSWSRHRGVLRAVLGRSVEGSVAVDLCRDGPHALVAGTTGAGKSELLQTLIAGLALAHPPDRCSFMLVDYKGGAAFAEAADLPHTVGVVTDLDARTTARALRSLGAELVRRETVLAGAGVADVADLPEEADLARLVIVVDEFAGLAEELPDFVPGLVAIAQRGRSLGVHLVLATQRPAGVVSPEIRANCSLRVCLRTTDESDSRDVLGTPAAASLPARRPGRAYLRVGASASVLLQAARVACRPAPDPDRPRVRRWTWPDDGTAVGLPDGTGPTDLARLVRELVQRADRTGVRRPHRPWCPPLPDQVTVPDLGCAPAPVPAGSGPVLVAGLVDRPDVQRQEALTVDLGVGGGWLAVGGPASGRSTFLRTVLAEAATSCSPDEVHVHVLDHDGGALARAAAGLPHTGTVVGADDPLRSVRLVDRLAAEVAERRATGRSTPRLLLLVDGVESLSAQLDEADPARGSAALLRLVREGGAAGMTCLLTADRAVPGGRLAAAVGTRLVLPLPDRADYGVAGIAARAVPEHRPPGRALLGEAAWECQLALPRPLPVGGATVPPRSSALRLPVLAPDPALPLPPPGGGADLPSTTVPVGPGGDEGHVLTVDLRRSGGLLVAGPPGSGRSAVLAAVSAHLAATGTPVLRVTGPGGRTAARASLPVAAGAAPTDLDATDLAGWTAWTGSLAGRSAVVVVDDHGTVAETPVVAAMTAHPPEGVVAVVSGAPAELSSVYRGPVAALRRRRSGLLLCPGPGDGDLLGVRLPRTPVPVRPGSGWLVDAGTPQRVQVALRRTPAPVAP